MVLKATYFSYNVSTHYVNISDSFSYLLFIKKTQEEEAWGVDYRYKADNRKR
jgi:hypothetical protein